MSSDEQSNRDVEAGQSALQAPALRLDRPSAMNSAHERIVYLPISHRDLAANSAQAGSRYRYEGTPFSLGA